MILLELSFSTQPSPSISSTFKFLGVFFGVIIIPIFLGEPKRKTHTSTHHSEACDNTWKVKHISNRKMRALKIKLKTYPP